MRRVFGFGVVKRIVVITRERINVHSRNRTGSSGSTVNSRRSPLAQVYRSQPSPRHLRVHPDCEPHIDQSERSRQVPPQSQLSRKSGYCATSAVNVFRKGDPAAGGASCTTGSGTSVTVPVQGEVNPVTFTDATWLVGPLIVIAACATPAHAAIECSNPSVSQSRCTIF